MRKLDQAFTLVEMLVSITLLALLVLFVTRLFDSAAAVIAAGNKRIDTASQVRPLLDRMALDFAQMVKRSDIDYFSKGTAAPNSPAGAMTGNDQIAFFSAVAGYNTTSAGPISLVAYRINGKNQMERMGKGLIWNGDTSGGTPVVFLPVTIAPTWPTATDATADSDYELIARNVFRFEYFYLLNNGKPYDTPWDSAAGHTAISGMQDVTAISVAVAAIDPKSRVILSNAQLTTLAGRMNDFSNSMGPGALVAQWQNALNTTTDMPRQAIAAVRIYQRYYSVARNR
jgi:prepilin-type N-terminal cleavage/methylation domain-containing protein